jgi:transposase
VHSPDGNYVAKLADVTELQTRVRASPGRLVLVYLDEFTFYRQPTLANAWEEQGHVQPLAERSHRSDTPTRVIGALNFLDGRVHYRRRTKITLDQIVHFYRDLRTSYPDAERIYVVQDNWPVHTHPDVLLALEDQLSSWPTHHPGSWSSEPSERARKSWESWHLPIQIVRLPTYASWTNPIEKLWHKLKADVLHLHPLADQLDDLRAQVDLFLDRYTTGSAELLHYVGLAPNT